MSCEFNKNVQQELYTKLIEAVSEIERGEKCADAEKFLTELTRERTKSQSLNG